MYIRYFELFIPSNGTSAKKVIDAVIVQPAIVELVNYEFYVGTSAYSIVLSNLSKTQPLQLIV
ncbi:MAG: hypothetical protein HC866_03430 [Leptolyngbyaceae cyanobacterium RU_5_1]|nr:hypothetical protein [Leptolyngbyaceae cyanobacterium RU_5_1]